MAPGAPCRIPHTLSTIHPPKVFPSPPRLQKSQADPLSSLALHNVQTDSPLHHLSPRTSSLSSIRQALAPVTELLVLPTPCQFVRPISQGQAHVAMHHKQMATAMRTSPTAFLPVLPRRRPHPAIPVISLLRRLRPSRRSTRRSTNLS
jgi:hypothetical protein